MQPYVINTTSVALYHSDMFQPSKGHPQEAQLKHYLLAACCSLS